MFTFEQKCAVFPYPALLQRRRLSLADRATMVPLLAAVIDFDADPETYERYDSMTALELFQKCAAALSALCPTSSLNFQA